MTFVICLIKSNDELTIHDFNFQAGWLKDEEAKLDRINVSRSSKYNSSAYGFESQFPLALK